MARFLKKERVQRKKRTKGKEKHLDKAYAGPVKDINSKEIFHDPLLCWQFLKDYFDIPQFQDICPEDIEDVSENYRPYLGVEFQADTVKRIRMRTEGAGENTLYLISLIEHKSQVDYNVSMQILRYMVCIWTEYAREMEKQQKGISKQKGFKYPPILPVVYYEGVEKWTADLHLRDRIMMNEVLGEYMPDFTYHVVGIHDYSNEELLEKNDEMSFLMMINKVQRTQDFKDFIELPQEKINQIIMNAPEHVLEIISATIWSLCMKMNVPEEEARQCVEKVRERRMGYLFENMEKMDIQAEREKTARVQKELEKRTQEMTQEINEMTQEKEDVIKAFISLCQEFGTSREESVRRLQEKCSLSKEAAEEKVNQYWQE